MFNKQTLQLLQFNNSSKHEPEDILYFLFQFLGFSLPKTVSCYPIYDHVQRREFKAFVLIWIEELKKSGLLNSDLVFRKSDDFKGPRYEKLILVLLRLVLRKKCGMDLIDASFPVCMKSEGIVKLLQAQTLQIQHQFQIFIKDKSKYEQESVELELDLESKMNEWQQKHEQLLIQPRMTDQEKSDLQNKKQAFLQTIHAKWASIQTYIEKYEKEASNGLDFYLSGNVTKLELDAKHLPLHFPVEMAGVLERCMKEEKITPFAQNGQLSLCDLIKIYKFIITWKSKEVKQVVNHMAIIQQDQMKLAKTTAESKARVKKLILLRDQLKQNLKELELENEAKRAQFLDTANLGENKIQQALFPRCVNLSIHFKANLPQMVKMDENENIESLLEAQKKQILKILEKKPSSNASSPAHAALEMTSPLQKIMVESYLKSAEKLKMTPTTSKLDTQELSRKIAEKLGIQKHQRTPLALKTPSNKVMKQAIRTPLMLQQRWMQDSPSIRPELENFDENIFDENMSFIVD